MAIQVKAAKNRTKPLLIAAGIIAVLTGGFLYWVFFTSPDIDLGAVDAMRKPQSSGVFATDILDDSRVKNLQPHGPQVVEVKDRGQKENPFNPF